METKWLRWCWVLIVIVNGSGLPARAQPVLRDNDHIAIIGDSITEKFGYSVYVEDYLLACQPAKNLRVTQFGYGGEHAKGALTRLETEIFPFNPTVATTCYGMNDGNYAALTPEVEKTYRQSQTELTSRLKSFGARIVMAGPGCVDVDTYTMRNRDGADVYNKTLGQLSEIVKEIASQQQVGFADVHQPMIQAMMLGKQKNGPTFTFAGTDGIHPSRSGHIVMTYAILKALGCNGDLGTYRFNLATGRSEVTEGHKIISEAPGKMEIQSSRYPFCFSGDPRLANSSSAALDLVPFNKELNRLLLIVTGAKSSRLKVTWGKFSREYTAAELERGINLADEFRDNPFSDAFAKVDQVVNEKQRNEFKIIKTFIHNIPQFEEVLPAEKETFARLRNDLIKKDLNLHNSAVEVVKPVVHSLVVEPIN